MREKAKRYPKRTIGQSFDQSGPVVYYRDVRSTHSVLRGQCSETGKDLVRVCVRCLPHQTISEILGEVFMGKLLKNALARQAKLTSGGTAKDADFQKRFPLLYEYLTTAEIDGVARPLSKISVFTDGGLWKGALNDAGTNATMWVTAESFDGVLIALEASASSDEPNWRPWTSDWKARPKRSKGA